LATRLADPSGPMVILHPYEEIYGDEIATNGNDTNETCMLKTGRDGVIFCLSNTAKVATKLQENLMEHDGKQFGLCCVKILKPTPADAINSICKNIPKIISIEESTLAGGFGSMLAEILADRKVDASLLRIGVPDIFVPAGNKQECLRFSGMSDQELLKKVRGFWPDIVG
jgi:1-deoxy-D-xylulose-5-phosphate synthase